MFVPSTSHVARARPYRSFELVRHIQTLPPAFCIRRSRASMPQVQRFPSWSRHSWSGSGESMASSRILDVPISIVSPSTIRGAPAISVERAVPRKATVRTIVYRHHLIIIHSDVSSIGLAGRLDFCRLYLSRRILLRALG